jgi:hypothetical protein
MKFEYVNKRSQVTKVNNDINAGKNIFLFISSEQCGHCINTLPEWNLLKKNNYGNNVVIIRIDYSLFKYLIGAGSEPMGYPTFRYINKNKGIIEEYNSGRTAQEFDKWIKSKSVVPSKHIPGQVYGTVYGTVYMQVYSKKNKTKNKRTKKNKKHNKKTHKRR